MKTFSAVFSFDWKRLEGKVPYLARGRHAAGYKKPSILSAVEGGSTRINYPFTFQNERQEGEKREEEDWLKR